MERERDEEVVEAFISEIRDVRDCSTNTVLSYRAQLVRFKAYLLSKGRTLLEADRSDFLDFKESNLKTHAPSSVRLVLNVLRTFYAWARDEGRIPNNPMPDRLRIKAKQQEAVDVPTAEQFIEIRRALAKPVADKRAVPQDLRRLIVEVLAGSGLRISALLTLKPRHLRLGKRPVILVEADSMACKGKTAGEVPLSPYAADLLKSYLQAHPMSFDAPIFDLSDWAVRNILKQASPKGLNLHPHSLRHFYCSMTYYRDLDGGRKDIIWVRDAAGHSNVATTDKYLKMARRVCSDDATWEAWAYGRAIAKEARSA